MSCTRPAASLDLCPTTDELVPQLLALLPRGRAWGTHDGGPFPGSTLYRFWTAVAAVRSWIEGRICALAKEFFCATRSETDDLWMEEYGLPDGCDPYPDLCAKVAAFGGSRCDYYRAVAARAGWAITCTDVNDACGQKAGPMMAGCTRAGRGLAAGVLLITVALLDSPAYVGGAPASTVSTTFAGLAPPYAGRMQSGGTLACPAAGELTLPFAGAMVTGGLLSCPPDLTALECLLTRIVGGHILLIFETALSPPSASEQQDVVPGLDGSTAARSINPFLLLF